MRRGEGRGKCGGVVGVVGSPTLEEEGLGSDETSDLKPTRSLSWRRVGGTQE